MKKTFLVFLSITVSCISSFGQLKFSMDSVATKQFVKEYCKEEKLDEATQMSLVLYAMKWCKVYGSLTSDNVRSGSCATMEECKLTQAEVDVNVEKLLGKDGYNKFADFLFKRRQQKFKK